MSKPAFQRKPPPLLARIAMGVLMDCVFRLLIKFGNPDRVFAALSTRRAKELAARNPFAGYVPTKHDVFVACYVKSGTNWTMQIAHQLLNHGKAEFGHIHDVIPWPDTKNMGLMRGYAVPLEDESALRASPEGKRVIKTHFHWGDLPYSDDARYIIVIRDPKDIFVSAYHFFSFFPVRSVDLWIKLFCSDNMFFGSWGKSTAGYWAQRNRPNVLLLSFKSMKCDLPGTVRKIAGFLQVRADEETIQRVVEKSSFEYMKTIEGKFGVWRMIPWRSQVEMMRKGAVGGSAELLSPDQQRQMDAYFMTELERLGSDFPYEEFCSVTPASVRAEHAGAA